VVSQSQPAIDNLKSLGFTDVSKPIPQRLIIKLAGPEKTGKTHYALTGPEPIIYFSIDIGTEGVVEKFQQSGKQVLLYEIKYERGKSAGEYKSLWDNVLQRLDAALQVDYGTLVIDTWTEIYELARLAHFGKLSQVQPHNYGPVYAELRGIIDAIYGTGMSAVLLAKMAKAFETKELEEKGFSDTDFKVQANLRTSRQDITNQETGITTPVFTANVKDCRQNPFINGMALSSVNQDGMSRFDMGYLIWLVHSWRPQ